MTQITRYRDKQGKFTFDPAKRSQLVSEQLYKAFDFFNQYFVDGVLPKVIITIQESGRKNALGWYGQGFWKDQICGQGVCEINISAEHMNRSAEGILETLLHEMAHLYNSNRKIRDVSSGQYHNKHFVKAAALFGLKASKLGSKGWAKTTLDVTAQEAIDKLSPDKDILTSLKRKKMISRRERRYMSLIVSADLEDNISEMVEKTGLSQRQFVEECINQYISNYE